jgi:UDP-glucose 4-epimerase
MVTGGAGFIGSHVVDRLAERGVHDIVVVDNLFLGQERNLAAARASGASIVFHRQDAADTDRLREIARAHDVSVIFDLATIPLPASLERPLWSSQTVYALALAVGELAREGTVERLVHCSTSEVYGSATYSPMDEDHPLCTRTPYAAAKAGSDLLLQSYARSFGTPCAIVRPFNTYGPRQNDGSYAGIIPLTLRRILDGEPPVIFGDGNQTRDFTYVEDTAALIVALAERSDIDERPVNVASGQEVRIRDLVGALCRTVGYEGDWEWRDERPGDVRRHVAGTGRLVELLGDHVFVGLEEGMAATVAWYSTHQRAASRPA